MSLSIIKSAFSNLSTCNIWSLQLLKITNSKRNGTDYCSRQIELLPARKLKDLINEISETHLVKGKRLIDTYCGVRNYDGTADALTIYRLGTNDELIGDEYPRLIRAITDPNVETDPFEYQSAYLLKGEIVIDGENMPVKLISMQNPITTLKHKFSYSNGTFRELSSKILSLRPAIDVLILGETLYFLTMAGENLFNMVRSYKAVCHKKVETIGQSEIIHGVEHFAGIAESGHNPRRFISFDESRLAELKKKEVREKMSLKFAIPLDASGDKFDATVAGVSEKIIKLLCNKGMTDPFMDTAVEVDGARKWQ